MSSPEALQEIIDADAAERAKDRKIARKKALAVRILITFAALAIWFWTQSLLGARSSPTEGIGDGLHRLTAPLNAYLHGAPRAANALLIASSALIDAIAIFLLASWIFGGKLRPFLGLGMLLVTRQVMQALYSLEHWRRGAWRKYAMRFPTGSRGFASSQRTEPGRLKLTGACANMPYWC